jgi:hypothetical protein
VLTIKHVEPNGHESIEESIFATYDPGVGPSTAGELRVNCSKGFYSEGIVYVMNESGKTIAKYDLDAKLMTVNA